MNATRVAAIAATMMVIFGVGWGFIVLGNPSQARERRFDTARVSDLQATALEVTQRYAPGSAMHETLPSTLPADFDAHRPVDGASARRDPQTNMPYRFIRVRDDTYKLCATFRAASELGEAPNGWSHSAGPVCFDLRTSFPTPYASEPAPAR